ncbi:leiomodin-2 [Anomaloglossus baeobatrachus]|uniref:leiomodin-2 n=1 Tax=Anomaloglossus baeobatrachus TaxID=238106 RepID=UPI003F507EC4
MSSFGYRREISKYEDIDEDELLASLSPEELQELERELEDIEPDRNLPVGMRQKSLTEKSPTANFSREALMAYWEKETQKLMEREIGASSESSKEEEDEGSEEDDFIGSNSEISEEVYTEEEEEEEEEAVTEEEEPVTEEEEQEEESEKEDSGKEDIKEEAAYVEKDCPAIKIPMQIPEIKCNGVAVENGFGANHIKYNRPADETVSNKTSTSLVFSNPTVIDEALESIKINDPETFEINLNNMENAKVDTLVAFAEALKNNTNVKIFNLANTHADDNVAIAIANLLRVNRSITCLNIESNFITGKGILAIMRALQYANNVLTELRFHNQRHIMGSQVEMEIVKLLRDNTSIVKLGYHFELPGPRMSMTSILTRNMDKQRQKRIQEQKESGYDPSSNLRTKTLQRGTPGSSPYPSPKSSPWSSPKISRKVQSTVTIPAPPPPPPPPPTPPPPPPAPPILPIIQEKKIPTRNIAELIKQHERSAKKIQNGHSKTKGKKSKKEKEQNNILKEIKNSLRAISDKKNEESSRPSTPQRSAHDDLMESIRGSSIRQLKKVEIPNVLR